MPLEWIFDPAPPSRSRKGGLANAQIFDPTLDAFVREVLQNSRDQRLDGQRVNVRFTLSELAGAELATFLGAVGWPQLCEHLEATALPQLVTIGPRLREGLNEIASGKLRILRIQDDGTRGLTGGEDDEGNFASLVRHELITSADRRESGGSFGLGKSVLWRFSNLSTVLFHSYAEDQKRNRFIGRTVLAGHVAEGERWEGSGWFGTHDPADPRWAISVWDDRARDMASLTWLDRPLGAAGTSILVVGFDDPGREAEPPIPQICEEISNSATRWFWPALLRDDISVLVEGYAGGENVFAGHAQATNAEVAPFVHAQHDTASVSDSMDEAGEVTDREIAITIPAQRPGRFEHPRPVTSSSATLRVRLAETGDKHHRNTVALQRGAGMVVQYRDVTTRAGWDQGFQAVLLAGRARGDSHADLALEEFLRAAEPPAHHEWTHTTERIKAEYRQGLKKALDDLFGGIDRAIRDLTREEVNESDEGPDALRRLFPLPGVGAVIRHETYRLAKASGTLDGDRWSFEGRYDRNPVDDRERQRDWEFKVALAVDQEGTGSPTRVPISELEAGSPATASGVAADGTATVVVPAGTESVVFSGVSKQVDALPLGGLRKVRLRMDLKGKTASEGDR